MHPEHELAILAYVCQAEHAPPEPLVVEDPAAVEAIERFLTRERQERKRRMSEKEEKEDGSIS